ncbi:MAG: LapA family protein [Bacillota bacterium]
MKPKVVVILVLVILFLIILIQNTHVTDLHLFFWSIRMSQIILIALFLVGGFITGYLTSMLTRKR